MCAKRVSPRAAYPWVGGPRGLFDFLVGCLLLITSGLNIRTLKTILCTHVAEKKKVGTHMQGGGAPLPPAGGRRATPLHWGLLVMGPARDGVEGARVAFGGHPPPPMYPSDPSYQPLTPDSNHTVMCVFHSVYIRRDLSDFSENGTSPLHAHMTETTKLVCQTYTDQRTRELKGVTTVNVRGRSEHLPQKNARGCV